MDRFNIVISEAGYAIRDNDRNTDVIEGIKEWDVACELQEMVSGECE